MVCCAVVAVCRWLKRERHTTTPSWLKARRRGTGEEGESEEGVPHFKEMDGGRRCKEKKVIYYGFLRKNDG